MIAFVFPGQGSQYVGMGKELCENYSCSRDRFAEANDILGYDLMKLCFEGDSEELRLTANAQPAILTASIAALDALRHEIELTPDYAAGHSLGEFSALVAAGAMFFADAVLTVRKRGEFMQAAVPAGVGAMSAVIGSLDRPIEEICAEISEGGNIVEPANYNSPGQVVISGNADAVKNAGDLASTHGARRVIPLEVSAPFHCELMLPAAQKLKEFLQSVEIHEMSLPVVTNVEAEPNSDPGRVKQLLVEQVCKPVRWEESVLRMVELGVKRFVEIGPGNVLTGLVKRTVKGLQLDNVENSEQIGEIKDNEAQR